MTAADPRITAAGGRRRRRVAPKPCQQERVVRPVGGDRSRQRTGRQVQAAERRPRAEMQRRPCAVSEREPERAHRERREGAAWAGSLRERGAARGAPRSPQPARGSRASPSGDGTRGRQAPQPAGRHAHGAAPPPKRAPRRRGRPRQPPEPARAGRGAAVRAPATERPRCRSSGRAAPSSPHAQSEPPSATAYTAASSRPSAPTSSSRRRSKKPPTGSADKPRSVAASWIVWTRWPASSSANR